MGVALITVDKHSKASDTWAHFRRRFHGPFIALFTVHKPDKLSEKLRKQAQPNGGPAGRVIVVRDHHDVHELFRAVKNGYIASSLTFAPYR